MKIGDTELTVEKIKALGRAIESKAALIHEIYQERSLYTDTNMRTKSMAVLLNGKLINKNAATGAVRLSGEFAAILANLDSKAVRITTMPDIEIEKDKIELLVAQAKEASDKHNNEYEVKGYLSEIELRAHNLADSLRLEMVNIDYDIHTKLGNTPSLRQKRIILNSLESRIKKQAIKINALNYDNIRQLHGGYPDAAKILKEELSSHVPAIIKEMDVYLIKTIEMIDTLKKTQEKINKDLFRLSRAIKTQQFDPKDHPLAYEDIKEAGLAFGGVPSTKNLANIDTSIVTHYLLTALDRLSSKKVADKATKAKAYDGEVVEDDDKEVAIREVSAEKQYAINYLLHNKTYNLGRAMTVFEYWRMAELESAIGYNSFLSLVLATCSNDMRKDNVVHQSDEAIFKIYLDKYIPFDGCTTSYIRDAKYIVYKKSEPEPSLEKVWKTV